MLLVLTVEITRAGSQLVEIAPTLFSVGMIDFLGGLVGFKTNQLPIYTTHSRGGDQGDRIRTGT